MKPGERSSVLLKTVVFRFEHGFIVILAGEFDLDGPPAQRARRGDQANLPAGPAKNLAASAAEMLAQTDRVEKMQIFCTRLLTNAAPVAYKPFIDGVAAGHWRRTLTRLN